MAAATTAGTMAHGTLASGKRTKLRALAPTRGSMGDSMRVSGSTITWMASVFTHGRTVASTEESTRMTRSTVTVSTLGLMDALTGGTGAEADSMA